MNSLDALNRLLLCRVLIQDCVPFLGLDPRLISAVGHLAELCGELPTRAGAYPLSVRKSVQESCHLEEIELERIGSSLPALLAELQARQPSPSNFASSLSSSAHSKQTH